MNPREHKPSGMIYLNYITHYIVRWPVTAGQVREMAASHGFSTFARCFGNLPPTTEFNNAEEVRRCFLANYPEGSISSLKRAVTKGPQSASAPQP